MATEHECNSGFPRYARRSPGEDSHNLYSKNITQRRKRSPSRLLKSASNKRQKSRQLPSVEAQIDIDKDLISNAENESDGVLDDRKEIIRQPKEVARIKDEYYVPAFNLIGQLGCKDIAKAWIKACHPQKQSKNPYNGGPTRRRSERFHNFQGALTAPSYWPQQRGWETGKGCRHKEPDHIKRAGLWTYLLVRHY